MSERTFNPKIHARPDSEMVIVEMHDGNYLSMSAEVARRFAGRLLVKANEAEGKKPVHMFMIGVEE